jgi:uncharacterized protein (AIM24 family)
MWDRLIGTTTLVLSIALDPGESVVAGAGEFAWMTDSIQMSTGAGGGKLAGSSLPMSTFTAKDAAGTVAFAARLPGSIVPVDITPGRDLLVHRDGFLAGTPAIQVTADGRQSVAAGVYAGAGLVFQHIGGEGRAWVELSGEPVRLELAASESLRAHPGHVGMFESTMGFQVAHVPGVANRYFGGEAHHFAVLSGPGTVWLQSTPLPVLAMSLAPYLASPPTT